MRFLDPKEEVYKVKITPYGKYLLSQGKFNPIYYSFFDDDIIYDSRFTLDNGNVSEEQNKIQDRILDETPRFEGQTSFQGSETTIFTKFPNLLDEMFPGVEQKLDDPSYSINSFEAPFDNYYLQRPLGKSGNNSSIAPFYSLKVLKGEILTASFDGSGSSGYFANKTNNPTNFTMQHNKKDLFVKLEEGNTEFLKENFDIEVFEIITTTSSQTGIIQENLKKLNFTKEGETATENNVEYYFNILVDNQIDPEFSDNTFKCPDIAKEKINLNIYNTDKVINPPDKC